MTTQKKCCVVLWDGDAEPILPPADGWVLETNSGTSEWRGVWYPTKEMAMAAEDEFYGNSGNDSARDFSRVYWWPLDSSTLEPKNMYILEHGIHDGTLISRDSGSQKFETREEALASLIKQEKFYKSIGYVIWFANLICPDGTKEVLRAGNCSYR